MVRRDLDFILDYQFQVTLWILLDSCIIFFSNFNYIELDFWI